MAPDSEKPRTPAGGYEGRRDLLGYLAPLAQDVAVEWIVLKGFIPTVHNILGYLSLFAAVRKFKRTVNRRCAWRLRPVVFGPVFLEDAQGQGLI